MRELGATGADQPGQADDLALPDVEGHARDAGRHEVPHAQREGRRRVHDAPLRVGVAERPPQHACDKAGFSLRRGWTAANEASVAQDGHAVRQLQHLLQEVRDQDDRAPCAGQPADDLVQAISLRPGERGGGLVEHEQLGVAGEGPQDLDLLLLRQREAAHGRVSGQVEAGIPGQPLEARREPSPVDDPGAPGLGAEEDVLGHAEHGHERELLGHERDAASQRVARGGEGDRLSA